MEPRNIWPAPPVWRMVFPFFPSKLGKGHLVASFQGHLVGRQTKTRLAEPKDQIPAYTYHPKEAHFRTEPVLEDSNPII